MKTKIIDIGNSQGIIIPKKIIEQLAIANQVDLAIEEQAIVIRPIKQPRQGWAQQYQEAGAGDEELLMGDYLEHSWDEEEWTWD